MYVKLIMRGCDLATISGFVIGYINCLNYAQNRTIVSNKKIGFERTIAFSVKLFQFAISFLLAFSPNFFKLESYLLTTENIFSQVFSFTI